MNFAVFIILLAYILLLLLLLSNKFSIRNAVIFSFVLLSLIIVVITEFLGRISGLNFTYDLIAWIFTVISLFTLLITRFKLQYKELFARNCLKEGLKTFKTSIKKLDTLTQIILVFIICTVFSLGIVAIVAYPNNYDAMTYHLPRVMHWIQDKNLEHYATHIIRQLYSNPFAEYIILHFIILGKADRLANLPQYFSMLISLVCISSISKYLGASMKVQIYSVLIALTLPVGLIQAPNTQNDYVLTVYLLCFVYSVLILVKDNESIRKALFITTLCSISLGLAILTKGTAYFFATPFVLFFGGICWYKYKYKCITLLLLMSLIPIMINGPHYAKNYNTFGNILGPTTEISDLFEVKKHSLQGFLSSVVRNMAIHVQIPDTNLRNSFEKSIYNFHDAINYKINDPATTIGSYYYCPKLKIMDIQLNDHYAANTFHLILGVVSLLAFLTPNFRKKNKDCLIYSLLVLSSFLLFCLFVKWQPFATRLHLGVFVLLSPLIAQFISYIEELKMFFLATLILFILAFNTLPYVFASEYRPIVGNKSIFKVHKYQQYYANFRKLYSDQMPCLDAVLYFRKSKIGIIIAKDHYEYPLWARMRENNQNFSIEHVQVKNASKKYEKEEVDVVLKNL